jgi:surface polysaccharide O-acyltransferase-like enzyme
MTNPQTVANKVNASPTAYLSFLSILSSLAVVYLHFNEVFWEHPTYFWTWFSANIIESTFYFAVPIFFMISGCTLIDYSARYTTTTFFTKRLKKVFIPFIIWSLVAFLYVLCVQPDTLQTLTTTAFLWGILDAKYMNIYWFFMPLFSIYLSIPILSAVNKKRTIFLYMLIVGLFFTSLVPFVQGFEIRMLPTGLSFPICAGYLIYPILGYLLHTTNIQKKWRILIYILGLIGVLLHIFVTTFASPIGEPITMLIKGYTKVPTVLYACAIFLFAKEEMASFLELKFIKKAIDYFKPVTFGIYLLHLYMHFFFRSFMNETTSFYRFIMPIVAFLLLTILIRTLQRIKGMTIALPK